MNCVVSRDPRILDRLTQIRTAVLDLAVMDEYSGGDSVDVEVMVVVTGDGEVPHPVGGNLRGPAADDGGGAVDRGAKAGAVFEGGGLDSPVRRGVPEQMVRGGLDDRGAVPGLDSEVVEVGVVADQDGGDRLGLGPAGLGVGGQDLLARPQG